MDSVHSDITCLINHGTQYQYLRTCDKWGVDFDIVNVKNMITRSDKSRNVAIQDGGHYDRQKHWKIYISTYRSVTKTHRDSILI